MPVAGQTITIINQSGKVVNTSKHLINVFKEAKSAYGERKAEIRALRRQEEDQTKASAEHRTRKKLEALTLADDEVGRKSANTHVSRRPVKDDERHTHRRRSEERPSRPPMHRGVTDSYFADELHTQRSPPRWNDDEPRVGELARRHTEDFSVGSHRKIRSRRPKPTRRASLDDIDMDLAYGELPPPLPERKYDTEVELRSKMLNLQQLLDEFNCIQHSVTSTIDSLQKKPDALAAVALTLAEISSLITKMAPSALVSLKSAFPGIIALLASPQFAIAAGVGVGVTIIAFGGYKIIKKIKAQRENLLLESGQAQHQPRLLERSVSDMDELREIDRIEQWRRGIVDVEGDSVGASVDGELLTPQATRTLIEEGRLREADLKTTVSSRTKQSRKKAKSEAGSRVSGASSSSRSKQPREKRKKKKEPSGLRMLFKKNAYA